MNCPHRGHRLRGDNCPYHGLDPRDCRAYFVNPRAMTTVDQKEIKAFLFDKFDVPFLTISQRVQCPSYVWLENTMDPNHLRHVHKDFAKNFHSSSPVEQGITADGKMSFHKLRVSPMARTQYELLLKVILPETFTHIFEYPNQSYTSFLDVFLSSERVLETADGNCFVITSFYVRKGLEVPPSLIDLAAVANLQILLEDKAICESWAPTYKVTGNWLAGEERIKAYYELRTGVAC